MAFEVIFGITAAILAIYYYFTTTFDFWKSRGIRGPQPVPVFGNVMDLMLARKSLSEYMCKVYNDFKEERMVGIFSRKEPVLFLKDPDLIKDVLIKDFSVFPNRAGFSPPGETEKLAQHMFALEVETWRPIRTKLSSVFSSSKLKEMFPVVLECAKSLEQHIEKLADMNEPVECHELVAKYTTDVIGRYCFGIEMNALSDEDSEFRKLGRTVFISSWYNIIRLGIRDTMPRFYTVLDYILPETKFTKFFLRMLSEIRKYRQKNNIIKHDFMDMLSDLKEHPEKFGIKVTDSLINSQAFLFFIAGFQSSSLTISHALYELALNPKVQDKLREEIHNKVEKYKDDFTYDIVKNMTYLEKVLKETLRKYPVATFLSRRSVARYTFNGTNITIPKGQRIWIPIFAIHRDPQFYPEPDVFDPERFNQKSRETRHTMCYLPIGNGPRYCIGARFAIYETKIVLIKILQNYKVGICEKTQIPYQSCPKAFILTPKCGVYLSISKIDSI